MLDDAPGGRAGAGAGTATASRVRFGVSVVKSAMHERGVVLYQAKLAAIQSGNVVELTRWLDESPTVFLDARLLSADLLKEAIESQHPAVVTLLLARGASATNFVTYGATPLALAQSKGCSEEMRTVLIAAGARETIPSLFDAMNQSPAQFRMALGRGPDLSIMNPWGMTLLGQAVTTGTVEHARALVDAGADVNQRDGRGFTALMRASVGKKKDFIGFFLSLASCDVNAMQENTHESALLMSLNKTCYDEGTVSLLLNHPRADIEGACQVLNFQYFPLVMTHIDKLPSRVLPKVGELTLRFFMEHYLDFARPGIPASSLQFLLDRWAGVDSQIVSDESSPLHGVTFFQCFLFILLFRMVSVMALKNRGRLSAAMETSFLSLSALLPCLSQRLLHPRSGITPEFLSKKKWDGWTVVELVFRAYGEFTQPVLKDNRYVTDRATWDAECGTQRQESRDRCLSACLAFFTALAIAGVDLTGGSFLKDAVTCSLDCSHGFRHDDQLIRLLLSVGAQVTPDVVSVIDSAYMEKQEHRLRVVGSSYGRVEAQLYPCLIDTKEEHAAIRAARRELLTNPPPAHDVVLNHCLGDFFKEMDSARVVDRSLPFATQWDGMLHEDREGFFVVCAAHPEKFFALLGLLKRGIFPSSLESFVTVHTLLEVNFEMPYAKQAKTLLLTEHPRNGFCAMFLDAEQAKKEAKETTAAPVSVRRSWGLSTLFRKPGASASVVASVPVPAPSHTPQFFTPPSGAASLTGAGAPSAVMPEAVPAWVTNILAPPGAQQSGGAGGPSLSSSG